MPNLDLTESELSVIFRKMELSLHKDAKAILNKIRQAYPDVNKHSYEDGTKTVTLDDPSNKRDTTPPQ